MPFDEACTVHEHPDIRAAALRNILSKLDARIVHVADLANDLDCCANLLEAFNKPGSQSCAHLLLAILSLVSQVDDRLLRCL